MGDMIKPLELGIFNARQKRDKTAEDMHTIKKAHTMDILDLAKDKNNGLTNQTLRDAALDERLDADPEYQRLSAVLQTLETDIALMSIDLGFEKRKFQVWYVEQLKEANQ